MSIFSTVKINPLSAGAGILGGVLGGIGANKAAKAKADNENAMNSWNAKLNGASYGTEKMPYYQQGSKMRGWRDAMMRGVMRNPTNGLSKLFAGWDQGKQTAYDPGADRAAVSNPFDVAGAPPKLKSEGGGWAGALGAGLKGLAGGLKGLAGGA